MQRPRKSSAFGPVTVVALHEGQCQLYNNPELSNSNPPTLFLSFRHRETSGANHKMEVPHFISKLHPAHWCNLHLLADFLFSIFCDHSFRRVKWRLSTARQRPASVRPTLKDVCKQKHAIWMGSMASTKPIFVYPAVYIPDAMLPAVPSSFTL